MHRRLISLLAALFVVVPVATAQEADEKAAEKSTPSKEIVETTADKVDAKSEGAETKGAAETGAPAKGIPWAATFEAAMESAAKTRRPVLVDFGAEWCGWCKKLDRETFSDARVISLVREFFEAVKVDTDDRKDLATKYKVRGLPTILVLSPEGKVLQDMSGFRPPETFLEEIRKSASAAGSLEKLREIAEKSPDDVDAQRAYARAIFAAGSAEEAGKVLEKILAKHGDNPDLLLDLAEIARGQKQSARARELYEKVLSLPKKKGSDSAEKALLPLARLLIGAKETDAAIARLDTFVKDHSKSPKLIECLFLRAYAHSIKDDAARSIADLGVVVELAPESEFGIHAAYILDIVQRTR